MIANVLAALANFLLNVLAMDKNWQIKTYLEGLPKVNFFGLLKAQGYHRNDDLCAGGGEEEKRG